MMKARIETQKIYLYLFKSRYEIDEMVIRQRVVFYNIDQ